MSRLLVWDFDGTLVDSRQLVAASQAAALQALGYPAPDPDQGIGLIGLPLTTIFPTLVGRPLAPPALAALVDAYREAYLARAAELEQVYAGIPELLARAASAGRLQAVATGKSTEGAHAGAHRHGLHHHFARLYGFDAVPDPKPGPGLVHRIRAELQVDAADTVVIGDTTFDVDMGRSAGVRTIAVTWGAHPPERLAHAHHVVHTVSDLAALLDLP